MKRMWKQVGRSPNFADWPLKISRWIAIVTICLFLMMLLTSCASNEKTGLRNNCLEKAVTWGQYLECAIELDVKQ